MGHLSEETLNAWVDGMLPLEEASRVEDHLRTCPSCQRSAWELRRLCAALETLPGAPKAKEPARRTTRAWKREKQVREERSWWPAWAGTGRPAAYAVVVAGLLFGMILGNISQSLQSHVSRANGQAVERQASDTLNGDETYLQLLTAGEDMEI